MALSIRLRQPFRELVELEPEIIATYLAALEEMDERR